MRRYQVGHTTLNTNVLIRAEIHDSLLGVASSDELVGDGTIQYSHQRLDPSQYTEIQSGELSIGVHIQTDAHRTLRNDILNASEGRFELHLYFDNVFEWKGTILPDLCEYTESFDEVLTLKAKDFTLLKKDLFALSTTRETIITTIESILSGYSMPIVTATSWIESNTTSANDFLRQIYHDRTALRQFVEGDDTDVKITNEQALRWILRSYGLTLKQSGGALRIDQFTAYENSASVLISNYEGGFQSQALTNVRQTSSPITIDSINKPNVALKRVTNTFNHRTQTSAPSLPDTIRHDGGANPQFTFQVVPDSSTNIELSAIINAQAEVDDNRTDQGYAEVDIRLRVGQYYWDGEEWVETVEDIEFRLDARRQGLYIGAINIETDNIPEDATTPIEITFGFARASLDYTITETLYRNVQLNIATDDVTEAILFELTNADSYTQELDYPTSYFGDGPLTSSPSALRFSLNQPDITSNSWQRRDGGTLRGFHANLLHEILDPRRGFRRVLNATIKGTFEPHKILSYDSTFFYYLGGTFDGYTGNWSVQLVKIEIQDLEEVIATLLTQRISSLVNGLGAVVNLTTRDIRRLLGITNTIGVTTLSYSTFTTTLAAELNVPMRSGVEYWVVNIDQLDWRDLTAGIYSVIPDFDSSTPPKIVDYGTGIVNIDEQLINAPIGSIIVKAPAQTEIDNNLQEERDEDFDKRIGDVDTNITELETDLNTLETVTLPDLQTELDAILPITTVKISDNAISAPKIAANAVIAGKIAADAVVANSIAAGSILTSKIGAGAVTALKIDVADLAASSAFIDELTAQELVIRTGGFIQGSNYKFDDVGGNIAGWIIDANTLRSAASGSRRIELNKSQNRVSIFDTIGEKAVMGYLNGLPKNKGVGNWGVADYGFWAKDGDNLVIDGDVEYDAGDWIVKNDGSYLVQDASGNTIIRLGTDAGDKGLFLYNTVGTLLAGFVSGGVIVGVDGSSNYMKYTTGGGLVIRGGLNADDITAWNATVNGALTIGANGILKSTNFNGTIDVNNDITANGTTGWAIDNEGKAVFNDVFERNGTYENPTLNSPIFIFPTRTDTAAAGVALNTLSANAMEIIQIQITVGDGSAAIDLNGIVPITVGGSRVGTKVTISNSLDSVNPSNVNINNQNASATAINRIKTPTGTAFSLGHGDSAELFYDVNIDRWIIISSSKVL